MSLQDLLNIKDEHEFIMNCRRNLPLVGIGSSRNVYKLNDSQVLKVAKNTCGYLQNNVECNSFNEYKDLDIFAHIIDKNDDYLWLIQPFAISLKEDDEYFKQILEVVSCIEESKQYSSNKVFLNTLYKYLKNKNYKFLQDFKKHDSYGIIDGNVYIIDYGMTDEIFNNYFNR